MLTCLILFHVTIVYRSIIELPKFVQKLSGILTLMIKTWFIDAIRNIKKRFVSWLSIVTIVLIGTTLILGLFFASSTVEKATSAFAQSQNFKDFDVSASTGLRQEDISVLKGLEAINDAEGQISVQGFATLGENSAGVTIISSTERISVPTVMQGRLPASSDECIVSFSAIGKLGAHIDDEITISIQSERFTEILPENKYKITGIASHPDYMVNISTDYIVLPLSSFDTSQLSFDYSNILVDADISEDIFKKPYKEKSSQLKEIIEKEADSILEKRSADIIRDLDSEYDNAKKKTEDELNKGKADLDEAKKLFEETIKTAEDELSSGELQLDTLKDNAEKELKEAERQIKEGEAKYNTMVADGQAQLDKAEKDMEDELTFNKWRIFDGFLELDKAEKLLKEKEEEYRLGKEKLSQGKEELEKAWKEYNSSTDLIDKYIGKDRIDAAISLIEDMDTDSAIKKRVIDALNYIKELDLIEKGYALFDIIDSMPPEMAEKIEDMLSSLGSLSEIRDKLDKITEGKRLLEEKQKMYDDAVAFLDEARAQLDQGWYDLEKGKEKLAEGEAELARREPEVRAKLADAKAEFESKKAQALSELSKAKSTLSSKKQEASETIKKLEDELLKAKDEYNTKKEDGEKELKEASAKYEDAKREADEKLSEVKDQIDAVKDMPAGSMVQTRDVNFPFVQTKSYIKAIRGFFSAFTPLYAGIIAIVCFFTMTIIIEEQTSQIGTSKAFGMYESEIMRKYIVFGASGALFGAILGVIGAFMIEKLLINTMKDNLAFPLDGIGHNIAFIILLPVMEVLITVVAVLWSCHRYIKCSAVGLINGSEPAARYRKKEGFKLSGNLYTNLIFNNLLTDIGREVVSVVTIVMCVFIVGFGIDIKLAYEGALKNQMYNIWQYDLTLTESGTITDEEKEAVEKALSSYDTLYLPITAGVITDGEAQVLTSIICVDDKEEFGRFYILKAPSGKSIEVFDDGVLVTKEMEDKNALSAGSTVSLTAGGLSPSEVSVKGIYMLYAGKTMIMTKDYYKNKFGSEPVSNTYYVKAGSVNEKELQASLSELPGVSSVELTKNLRDRNMAVVNLYNAVVVIVILFSVLLSFMILLNLSNILVAHRMKEILTMRANGFSNAQVIGYLVREVMLIEALSIVIALAFGMPLTSIIIKNLETDAFMFVRSPFALAWTGSVLINLLFCVTINFIAFRNVNKVPLTNISRYD